MQDVEGIINNNEYIFIIIFRLIYKYRYLTLQYTSIVTLLISCDLICRDAHLRFIMYLPQAYPQAEVFSLAGLQLHALIPTSYTTQ